VQTLRELEFLARDVGFLEQTGEKKRRRRRGGVVVVVVLGRRRRRSRRRKIFLLSFFARGETRRRHVFSRAKRREKIPLRVKKKMGSEGKVERIEGRRIHLSPFRETRSTYYYYYYYYYYYCALLLLLSLTRLVFFFSLSLSFSLSPRVSSGRHARRAFIKRRRETRG